MYFCPAANKDMGKWFNP